MDRKIHVGLVSRSLRAMRPGVVGQDPVPHMRVAPSGATMTRRLAVGIFFIACGNAALAVGVIGRIWPMAVAGVISLAVGACVPSRRDWNQ